MANDNTIISCSLTTDKSSHRDTDPLSNELSNELRFPIAAADGSIGDLLQNHLPNTMLTHVDHDEESLAGSTYEIIDTDVESRDGHATASIASTDFGRPDDVASLVDTEQSEDDSIDEEAHDTSASIPSALRSLEQTSVLETPTIGRSTTTFYDESQTRSIEFEEFFATGAETVSVKHTVVEFSDELTKQTVQNLNLQNAPEHLSLTIRQTMTKSGLTTKDPLRVLYVGSHGARQDIVTKIASCLSASNNQGFQHYQSQIYNVVPVSASAEEVELMQSSGLQIKVEDCVDAECMPFENDIEKPEIIKLRLTESGPYHSVPEGKTFIVEPSWDLPHLAVFYCSNSDTSQAKQTRSLVRKFMSRHSIPSLVITHEIILNRSMCLSLDPHAVHMCLEARAEGRSSLIRHRLPIDLTSFLNIDARQMSRNLAYITGLHKSIETMSIRAQPKRTSSASHVETAEKKDKSARPQSNLAMLDYRIVISVGVFLLSLLATLFANLPAYTFTTSPAISINSNIVQPALTSTPILVSITSTASLKSYITTSTDPQLSTKATVPTNSPRLSSLSVVPSKEVRVVPVASPQSKKSNTTTCFVEKASEREILIHVPGKARPRWLSRDTVIIHITKRGQNVSLERVHNLVEGIVVLLPSREAHGVMDVTISTQRKPRIDETFQVDFGTTNAQTIENIKSALSALIEHDKEMFGKAVRHAQLLATDLGTQTRKTMMQVESSTVEVTKKLAAAGSAAASDVKALSTELVESGLILSKHVSIQAEKYALNGVATIKQIQKPAQQALLKAQVQSKLAWLRLQGKTAEYEEYRKRAFMAMTGCCGHSGIRSSKTSVKNQRSKWFRGA